MLTNLFETIYTDTQITGTEAIISLFVTLLLGLIISFVYLKTTTNASRDFAATIILIPALISVVITMVNGNSATSIAILGAFSLIRFRSMQGTSKELSYILFTMALGLATGVGYLWFALFLTVVVCMVLILLHITKYGEEKSPKRNLRITIPENLDYEGIFADIFAQYLSYVDLIQVKTTNLGSMYELQYHIIMKDKTQEKEMIDAIRTRNGNLNIICGRVQTQKEGL